MPELRRSLRDRLTLQFLLLTTLTIVVVTVVAVAIAGAHMKQRILMQLSSNISLKEDLIEQRLQRDWEQISLWAQRPTIQEIVRAGFGEDQLVPLLTSAQDEGIPIVGLGIYSPRGEQLGSVGTFTVEELYKNVGGGIPLVDEQGWYGHSVFVPVTKDGDLIGFLGAQFDMRDSLSAILIADNIGSTAEILLGREQDGELELLHHGYKDIQKRNILGPLHIYMQQNDPLAKAVLRQEGVMRTTNYEERDVFAAYRYLPRIGWGFVLSIDADEALVSMKAITFGIGVVSLLLLGLSILVSIGFATKLTAPLHKMSQGLRRLGPNHWDYKRTVHSGDELELADDIIHDMASRLQRLYEHLEEEVRKRTVELREQYEIDQAIISSTLHGMILVDPEGNVVAVNPAASELLGKDAKLSRGLPVLELLYLYRKSHSVGPAKHPVVQCLQSGKSIIPRADVHWSVLSATEELVPITLSVTPVFDGEKILGAVAVFRDVTEERRVEDLKSEFISLASHQLRTPLSVIKWYSELLEEPATPDKLDTRKQYILEIGKAGDRMSNLVDALLQAAQLESKGIFSEKKQVDMNTFVSDLEDELLSLAKDRTLDCSVHVPEESVVLHTDPILLHIVLQNLFSNSVKYTEDGGKVSISLKKDHEFVEIDVKDTGMGIPQKASKRIFQRLFRAENAKGIDTDGSGLGLYISHMIMEILGGTISFQSKEGSGTTFTVRIPEIQEEQK